jgi:hypothetical protein
MAAAGSNAYLLAAAGSNAHLLQRYARVKAMARINSDSEVWDP